MAKKKKTTTRPAKTFSEAVGIKNIFGNDIVNFLIGTFLLFIAIYVTIAFISYFSTGQADQSMVLDLRPGEVLNSNHEFENYCGSIGALVSWFFIARCFGISAFAIPIIIGLIGLRLMKAYKVNLLKWFLCLMVIMIWCSVTFAKFLTPIMGEQVFNPGGDHGLFICQTIENLIGPPGLTAVLVLTALIFLTYLSAETIDVVRKMLNPMQYVSNKIPFKITNNDKDNDKENEGNASPVQTLDDPEVFDDPTPQTVEFPVDGGPVVKDPGYESNPNEIDLTNVSTDGMAALAGSTRNAATDDTEMTVGVGKGEEAAHGKTVVSNYDLNTPINPKEPWTKYKYPTLDLLKKYESDGKPYIDMDEQTANKHQIVNVLSSFGVQIRNIKATVGPTITLYEIQPAEGVRISKIQNLEKDIALSLAALGIRIIAPIPGKGTIGIEVPNKKANIVSMESILNSKKFQESRMELPLALGKTITNEVFMVDLAKIPHLLVAGATGQGKSVGLNAIITSLLYKKHPNELKIVLIDPKKVEFSVYAPIEPHFMAKVEGDDDDAIITDVSKVVRTLNSLCKLMDHRYDMLKMVKARNIKEYNEKYIHHELNPEQGHEYMPYIVVIIDEFGDLIMTAGKEVELPIARIAQLARAVGIHMVIATQRPTTNIITGTIKANFPGRIAFRVSAMIDSRTILDRPGANQLIGKGDMLVLNGGEPVRVQCAFVDTPEVERINNFIAEQPGPLAPLELPVPATDEGDGSVSGGGMDMGTLDPLFEDAAHAIVVSQQGSTSMVQRRFAIGYNRAGRLMDQLEKAGIVGAAQGSKPREVLITDENSLETLLLGLRR
ncbi:MAG: DNA translocase FtsK 4TM domain-containing protein [Prevotella sp.]|nr:DNA translocase FtsK 4TM domain-containing protein [Prevotella sp.]